MTAKQLTRIGVFHIEEAILETLFHAEIKYTRAADIARAIGLKSFDQYDWIIAILLSKLEEEGRVEARVEIHNQKERKTGWKLTSIENFGRID